MNNLKLHLRDLKKSLVEAWKVVFADCPDVEVSYGDIFDGTSSDALVSPANAFAWMDGGIDLVYSDYFGWKLSEELRKQIDRDFEGELLVGQAAVIDIRPFKADTAHKYLISAPTMRVPMDVSQTVNAYLAFRATLRVARKHPEISRILCPGLGTAIGLMDPETCAKQMRVAWEERNGQVKYPSLSLAHRIHFRLLPKEDA